MLIIVRVSCFAWIFSTEMNWFSGKSRHLIMLEARLDINLNSPFKPSDCDKKHAEKYLFFSYLCKKGLTNQWLTCG